MEPASALPQSMRITYAVTKASWGGSQQYVYMLASGAHGEGALVHVITGGQPEDQLIQHLAAKGISYTLLPSLQRDIGVLRDVRTLLDMVRLLRNERPQALHLNSSKIGVIGALAGRIVGVKRIIFTAHGWPFRESRSVLWKIGTWLASWITVLLSHRVIAVSKKDVSSAPALSAARKLVLVHNGISETTLYAPQEARAELAKKAPRTALYTHLLLMNAELHKNKGIDVAIRALARILETRTDVALVIQGSGEERQQLIDLAEELRVSEHVFLLPFSKDARALLPAATMYLMPSRKEGLPLALLEAGYAGVPVIASSTGGIPDIVQDGISGLLIATANAGELATAIQSLLSDVTKRAEYGAALQEKVRSRFTCEQMVRNTFALYA